MTWSPISVFFFFFFFTWCIVLPILLLNAHTYNTLLLEADVDFIAGICGFFHNVNMVSHASEERDTFAWRTHLSSTIQHTAVTQSASKTHKRNVSLHDEQKVSAGRGGWGGTEMHNLSKSHQKPYLFTHLFNKGKPISQQMNLPVVIAVY